MELVQVTNLNRIAFIRDLFAQCSHQEQLTLLHDLPRFLCRDFISLLPVTVVPLVLCHLDPLHVISSCMLVSKSWRCIISDCTLYWKTEYRKLHKVVDSAIERSFRELTLSTLKFETCLSKSSVETSNFFLSDHDIEPIGGSSNWFYCINAQEKLLTLCYYSSSSSITSFKVNTLDTIDYSVKYLWSWSTNCGALLYINNGSWKFISYPPLDLPLLKFQPLKTRVWEGDVYSPAHFVFGGCNECRLVVKASRHMGEGGLWTIDLIKLLDEPANDVVVETLQYNFLPDPQLQSSCLFSARAVTLFPIADSEPSAGMFCGKHHLYIQIGIGIVVSELSCSRTGNLQLSTAVRALCPEGLSWNDIGNPDCSEFTFNKDQTLVALMPNANTLSVWNLEDGSYYSHSIQLSNCATKMFVPFVSKLYTIIGLETISLSCVDFFVLSTTTSRMVFKTRVQISSAVRYSSLKPLSLFRWDTDRDQFPFELCHIFCVVPHLSAITKSVLTVVLDV